MSWQRVAFVCTGLAVSLAIAADEKSSGFTVTSTDISQSKPLTNKQVFNGFGCSGENISPALSWSNAPAGTKSFAIMAYDPDAPTGSGWWHWVVYNIPATTMSLPAGAGDAEKNKLPSGAAQGRTDFGTKGFGGACPPPGKPHRYYFRVHALKVPKIDVPADATAAMIGFNVNANTIEKAEIMATYGR